MVGFYHPGNPEINAALGKVAIYHGHLEYILRMTIKSLLGLEITEALNETRRKPARELRERIQKEAHGQLGEGETFDRLNKLVLRSWRASDLRNEYLHEPWCTELDGRHVIRGEDHTFRPAPTVQEIEGLAEELRQIRNEINNARFEGGFLHDALHKPAGK
jgi:hypothetical protein